MRGTANILLVGLAAIGERSPKVGLVKFRNANTTCHAVFDKQRPYSEPGASQIVDITGRAIARYAFKRLVRAQPEGGQCLSNSETWRRLVVCLVPCGIGATRRPHLPLIAKCKMQNAKKSPNP